MNKNWVIKAAGDEATIEGLASSLDIERPLAQLLVQRGVKTFEEAKNFFRPDLAKLHDPFLMKDMDKAVARIGEAITAGEKVLVYGDYDVDGTTAVALAYSFFKNHVKKADYYIPDRYDEGYGISVKGIDHAAEHDFSLIIALDCGIKAVDRVEYARQKGIDFIICDHHNPGDTIPDAVAVLDPKQKGCKYPYKDLSGCGVGFKLIQAFSQHNDLPKERIYDFLDLIVVSIAADIVPITGENRILAHFGLTKLNEDPAIGMQAIKEVSGIGRSEIGIEDIVYKIGPRINAAGRMDSGRESVDLLVSEKIKDARLISKSIDILNTERRESDTDTTREAIEMVQSDLTLKGLSSTVVYNPKWKKGVIGIVASRLLDHFYRPTIVLTLSNGYVNGSARSVNGFDLYKAIEGCSDLLVNFGGHKYAAGLTMKEEDLPEFRKRFEKMVSENIDPEQLIPVVEIDTELQLSDITSKFFRILKQFNPFGPENPAPVFLSENVVDYGYGRTVGGDNEHLKLDLIQEEQPFMKYPAIAFHQGVKFKQVKNGSPFDICYQIMENNFRGKTTLQIHILDMKFD